VDDAQVVDEYDVDGLLARGISGGLSDVVLYKSTAERHLDALQAGINLLLVVA